MLLGQPHRFFLVPWSNSCSPQTRKAVSFSKTGHWYSVESCLNAFPFSKITQSTGSALNNEQSIFVYEPQASAISLPFPPLGLKGWQNRVEKKELFFRQSDLGYVCASLLSRVWLLATPWTVARQALLFMEFSRQEYYSGLSFPTPGDLPDPGIKPVSLASPALAGRSLPPLGLGSPNCLASNSSTDIYYL